MFLELPNVDYKSLFFQRFFRHMGVGALAGLLIPLGGHGTRDLGYLIRKHCLSFRCGEATRRPPPKLRALAVASEIGVDDGISPNADD